MPNSDTGTGSNSLERALAILEIVSRKSGGLSNAEISRRLRIATSSCSYILRRLEREGYVNRDRETGRYEVGLKVVAIAQGALRETGLRQIAEPALHRLARETQLSAHIGVLDCGRVMLVERVESPEFIKVDVAIGTQLPTHTTAMGKVLMASLSDQQVLDILEAQGLTPSTPNSIGSRSAFLQALKAVRKQEYAVSDEEEYPGVRCVAAGIAAGCAPQSRPRVPRPRKSGRTSTA